MVRIKHCVYLLGCIMITWFKKHKTALIGYSICIALMLWLYSCEPKAQSLTNSGQLKTQDELRIELDSFIATAELRFASIERQKRLRSLILNNALVIVEGQPTNPIGILTGLLAIYGTAQAAKNTKGAIKNGRAKRKPNAGIT